MLSRIVIAMLALCYAQAGVTPLSKVDRQLLDDAAAVDRQLDRRGLVLRAPALEEHMASLILGSLPRIEHVDWRFRVLRDSMINAFALPNGTVYVNTGLLARIENDQELTAVLAHETAHVIRKHPYLANREARRRVLTAGLFVAGSTFFGWGVSALAAKAVSQAGMDSVLLGYKAAFEQEADQDAVELLKVRGTDPEHFIRLLTRLEDKLEVEPVAASGREDASYGARAGSLRAAFGGNNSAQLPNSTAFCARFVSAIVQNVQLDISSRRFRSALAGAQRLVNAQPESSDCWFWLGEAYRSLGPRQEKLTENERTPKGQRASYEHGARLTEQEEFNQLAAAAEGRAVLLEHQAKAAECYRKAALLNPQSPHPALGLGMLYEQQGKGEEAMAAYKLHLEIAPQSPERARVEGRLKALATGGLK